MKRVLLGGLCLALIAGAWAAPLDLVLTGSQQTVQLQPGDSVNLVGDSNQLRFVGDCGTLDLVGSNNEIHMDGKVGLVHIVGSNNRIYWLQSASSSPPTFQSLGSQNQLLPARP